MSKAKVFVCDDEWLIREWFQEHLAAENYAVQCFGDGESLLEAIDEDVPDLVLLDLRLPGISGLVVLERIQQIDSSILVIMMTAYGEVEVAVSAVRSGAHHFVEKPVNLLKVVLLIDQALEMRGLRGESDRSQAQHHWQFPGVKLVGRSKAIRDVAGVISRLGEMGSPANVCVQGESGTGKDVVARAIHAQGPRGSYPFLDVNCTALPEALIESELFGHEAGAFTGAGKQTMGLFEAAHKGTVFLDEIGDMPLTAQAKLLQFLETHVFRRVGGVRSVKVDVQIIAATNRNLKEAVESGDFREDLFYRLNVVPIYLPPLRERREDIAPLASHFCEILAAEMRRPCRPMSAKAIEAIERFDWPGNARQLRNVVERILLFHDEDVIDESFLPPEVRGLPMDGDRAFSLPPSGIVLDEIEKNLLLQALEQANGNKTGAARLLGLTRDTLRYRLVKHGIE